MKNLVIYMIIFYCIQAGHLIPVVLAFHMKDISIIAVGLSISNFLSLAPSIWQLGKNNIL
jgi:hypothetical protein